MDAKIVRNIIAITNVIILLAADSPLWLRQLAVVSVLAYYLVKHILKEEN